MALGTLSRLVIFGNSPVVIPLLPEDSGLVKDPALHPIEPSSPVFGPVNVAQGTVQPVIDVLAPADPSWFNPYNLQVMFRGDYYGQLQSLGSVQYRHATDAEQRWSACKLAALAVIWGAAGTPVLVRMVLLPYGASLPPVLYDGYAVSGQPLLSAGVSYLGGFAGVEAGRIALNNRLVADTSSTAPFGTRWSQWVGDRMPYPTDYQCDSPVATLEIAQQHGAWTLDSGPIGPMGWAYVDFADAYGRLVTRCSLWIVRTASREQRVSLGEGRTARRFVAVRPSEWLPLVAWT